MTKRNKTALVTMSLMLVAILTVLGACQAPSQTPNAGNEEQTELSGTITESGSTSVKPLAEEMAAAFMQKHPKVQIEIGGGGSGKGVSDCAAGISDIGAASRPVKLSEQDMIPYPIARDAVAIVVNKANTVTELTMKQVAQIYVGEISSWAELGWADGGDITVYCREKGSGTMDCFVSKLIEAVGYEEDEIIDEAERVDSNAGMQAGAQGDESAIAFVSLGYVQGLQAVKLEGIEATMENCASGEYPVLRKLDFLTKTCPDEPLKSFIDFCRSDEGQQIAEELGYVPLKLD
ncbi:MAG: phosphate ABC transporter substrate-binding protein [Dehalococcoidia bacterium]